MTLTSVIGEFPYRVALAGGWIDQPFLSSLNPTPPGAMVVVGLEPTVRFMERSGFASGTRRVALRRWGGLPNRDLGALARELYAAENEGSNEPSGSQDMIGLLYPGINRLDYDATVEGGYFPAHIETCLDPEVAGWLERVLQVIAVGPRPAGYHPLGVKNLDREWVRRLGQAGKDCYAAIVSRDVRGLGASMNECMRCWETLLPHTVAHPTLTVDLKALLGVYQARYCGAMYSGSGGGYLVIASDEPVPGAFRMKVRLA